MSAGAWVRSVRNNSPVRPAPLWVWAVVLGVAGLAGLSVSNPVLAIVFLAGAGLIALVQRIFSRPQDGFVVALALFPFYTFLRGAAQAYHVPLPMEVVGLWPEVLLCVMMAGILCQRIRQGQKLRVAWDDLFLVLLLFSNLYGVVLSVLEKDAVGTVYGFHQSVTPLLFFFVARWLMVPYGYLSRLVRVWLVSFCWFAVASFADYVLRPAAIIKIVIVMRPGFNGPFDPYDFYRWYPRMQSLLFGEQFWGTVCVFAALYALIAVFEKGRPLQSRIGLWITYLLSLTGLLCSMSRGAFVCFLVSVLVLLCFRGPHRRALVTTVLAMVIIAGGVYARFSGDPRIFSLAQRTGTLVSAATGGNGVAVRKDGSVDKSNSATNRMNQWENALEGFPLFPAGRGLGRAGSAAVMHNTSVNLNDAVSDGGYFRILAEVGLPGIVCFLIGLAGVMHLLLRLLRDRIFVQREDRTVALTLFAFLSGLLIHNIGGNAFDMYYIIPLIWIFLGLLVSRRETAIREAQSLTAQHRGSTVADAD